MSDRASPPIIQTNRHTFGPANKTEICHECLQKWHKESVTIVGGGAAGVAVALSLIQKAREGWSSIRRLTIIEKGDEPAAGLAYSAESANTILNRQVSMMPVIHGQPRQFGEWLSRRRGEDERDTEYPDRTEYGRYLKYLLRSVNQWAWDLQIGFRLLREEVIDIEQFEQRSGTLYRVNLEDGSAIYSKNVVLALGNYARAQYKHLDSPNYFPNPWPTSKLQKIPSDASVGVIGTNASAIDVVRILSQQHHRGPIHMMSRNGLLPRVEAAHVRPYLRLHALHTIARQLEKREISFDEAVSYLKIEIREHAGIELNALDILEEGMDPLARLSEDIHQAKSGNANWQEVMHAFKTVTERYWNSLTHEEKEDLLQRYHYLRSICRNLMPIENAVILESLMKGAQLEVIKGEEASCNNGIMSMGSGDSRVYVDYIVEATGLQYDVERMRSPLLERILRKKMLKPNAFGGLDVGFDDLKIRDGLYAIGSLTKGTHMLVEDVDRLACHAVRLTDTLVGLAPSQPRQVSLFVGPDIFSKYIMMQSVPLLLAAGHMPFIFILNKPQVKSDDPVYRFFEHSVLRHVIEPHYRKVRGLAIADNIRRYHIDVGILIGTEVSMPADARGACSLYHLKPGLYPEYRSIDKILASGGTKYGYALEYLGAAPTDDRLALARERTITDATCVCSALFDCHDLATKIVVEAVDKVSRGQPLVTAPRGISFDGINGIIEVRKGEGTRYGITRRKLQLADIQAMSRRVCENFATSKMNQGLQERLRNELVRQHLLVDDP
ncbi:Uu.00g138830.m01.CDS01 [Anthostomella pinea]|uniref:Uu.00g138830.m01.CDS01 n=1 Tax=Anthostomella pinea TaxID=933095 RepID=A0AAI8VPT9_9PEZI|nr:Uu.00g138830.m01.CDS01 [Anthostomella pinea]